MALLGALSLQELEHLESSSSHSHEQDDEPRQDQHRVADVAVVEAEVLPQVIWDRDLLPVVVQVPVVLIGQLASYQAVDGVGHRIQPVVLHHTSLSAPGCSCLHRISRSFSMLSQKMHGRQCLHTINLRRHHTSTPSFANRQMVSTVLYT